MSNSKRVLLSFLIYSIIYFMVIIALALITAFIMYQIGMYNKEPLSQGLCPSVGLNKTFLLNDLDMLIERYQIYLEEETHTPQFYDRVKELIEENYTLIGNKYYYNMYLESGIIPLEKINLIPFIIIDLLPLGLSLASFLQSKQRYSEGKIEINKRYCMGMIISSILTLNVYTIYKYVKAYKSL